jgi:hypothetical protein
MRTLCEINKIFFLKMYTWLNINFMNDQVRYIGSSVSLVSLFFTVLMKKSLRGEYVFLFEKEYLYIYISKWSCWTNLNQTWWDDHWIVPFKQCISSTALYPRCLQILKQIVFYFLKIKQQLDCNDLRYIPSFMCNWLVFLWIVKHVK